MKTRNYIAQTYKIQDSQEHKKTFTIKVLIDVILQIKNKKVFENF